MNAFTTPADFIVRGLRLPALPDPPHPLNGNGICCAITGQPISEGYPVADMVTEATAEFLDCFRGGVGGYVSEGAARCFRNADPRRGNPTARAVMIFADGTYYNPLISRASAIAQGRSYWSGLVREVWPARKGQQVLIILTTDMKRRLWPRARIGALGACTPMFCYDPDLGLNGVRIVDWGKLIGCLEVVEKVYSLGFPKQVIETSLYIASKVAQGIGLGETRALEREVAVWRPCAEFAIALLIAQKKGDP